MGNSTWNSGICGIYISSVAYLLGAKGEKVVILELSSANHQNTY
jgi:hypothetical protein